MARVPISRRGARGAVVALVAGAMFVTINVAVGASASAQQPASVRTTFECLGIPQDFVVPPGVSTIDVLMAGGAGGGGAGGGGRGSERHQSGQHHPCGRRRRWRTRKFGV